MALYRLSTDVTIEAQFISNAEQYQDNVGRLWLRVNDYSSALTEQVGGSHYKNFAIQPVEFIQKNGLLFYEGSIIKYVCRWRNKNGIEDLKKARHYIDMLIEMEENHGK